MWKIGRELHSPRTEWLDLHCAYSSIGKNWKSGALRWCSRWKSRRKVPAQHPPDSWADSSSLWQDAELCKLALCPLDTALPRVCTTPCLQVWLRAPQSRFSAISPECTSLLLTKHNGFYEKPTPNVPTLLWLPCAVTEDSSVVCFTTTFIPLFVNNTCLS